MKNKDSRVAFSKEQFLGSKQFKGVERDILSVVLQNNELYTFEEANAAIQTYLKRSVL